ncbi:translation initiation factor IF-2-like [Cuculus canorus]|uniref:translation initiation factor IF-2-like n=1 Tax=Cuculus canorus TaxID=55661 RepID=UPI0023AA75A9|nr:translation initiation factor IF-2-like [Cuculus canorus]
MHQNPMGGTLGIHPAYARQRALPVQNYRSRRAPRHRPRSSRAPRPPRSQLQLPACHTAPPHSRSTPAFPRKPMGAAVRAQGRRLLAVHRVPATLPGSLRGRRRPRCLRTRRVPLGAGRGERGRCLCRGAEPAARPGAGAGGGPSSCKAGQKSRCPHRAWRPRRRKLPRKPSRRSRDAPRRRPSESRRPPSRRRPRPALGGFSPALDGRGAKRRRSEPGMACPSVRVSFPGAVSRESGCRFARDLLKHVLYQRQQLPLPCERLGCFCRRDEDASKKPPSLERASKKWEQLLTDLEGLFRHMEVMFSLTRVPRVLFLLGGTVMSPREFYELNLESICEGSAEESLEPASCVRKLFRSLFVADVFSELDDLPVTCLSWALLSCSRGTAVVVMTGSSPSSTIKC